MLTCARSISKCAEIGALRKEVEADVCDILLEEWEQTSVSGLQTTLTTMMCAQTVLEVVSGDTLKTDVLSATHTRLVSREIVGNATKRHPTVAAHITVEVGIVIICWKQPQWRSRRS